MRVQVSKSKNSETFYIIKSFRDKETKKNTSKIVERLGTRQELEAKLGHDVDIMAWAKARAEVLTEEEKQGTKRITLELNPTTRIESGIRKKFCGGYLFLQSIYHELGLDDICADITKRHSYKFDLDAILSRLVYGRVLSPSSKTSTCRFSETLIEPPTFSDHQVFRSLEVLAKENNFIQSKLYKNSKKVVPRRDKILYYDCTNFFFEVEEADGFRNYGRSKEHRPNPLVQMGLFMDASGMPLACHIDPGNTNEQTTLIPLEEKILEDFSLSKFIVCTDAGLSSQANRKFNSVKNRQFITTQSIKTLKAHLKKWALDTSGWYVCGSNDTFNLTDIEEILDSEKTDQTTHDVLFNKTFYKERMIKEKVGGEKEYFEQRLIVTFSFKYQAYLRSVRQGQIERALRALEKDSSRIDRKGNNDFRRFIEKKSATQEGEVADITTYAINEKTIAKEAQYDGFYGLCTSLDDDDIEGILRVNANRWEIEECFRIMKSDFKARPAYLSRKDRIEAHFLTCYIAFLVFRILEKKLGDKYTCSQILDTLKDIDFKEVRGEGFEPLYTRTELTDDLHDAFGFHTDYEIMTNKAMKEIIKKTKKA